ncbi:MAG: hypothetical protein ABGZ53_24725, partial [Fuerstiella sp.]
MPRYAALFSAEPYHSVVSVTVARCVFVFLPTRSERASRRDHQNVRITLSVDTFRIGFERATQLLKMAVGRSPWCFVTSKSKGNPPALLVRIHKALPFTARIEDDPPGVGPFGARRTVMKNWQ